MVRQERPSFVFLCETIDNKSKVERVRRSLRFDGVISVDAIGKSGGLALMWRDKEQVQLRSLSKYHIDVEISMEGKDKWRLTGIYGEPDRTQRRKTWELLRNLARDSNLPWCVIGDLNNVISHQDKKGGAPYPDWLIEGFNETLADTGLIDMDLVGHQFTWEKDVVLQSGWRQLVIESWDGSGGEDIRGKIKKCGENLYQWGKEVTGRFSERLKKCKIEMRRLRKYRDPDSVRAYDEVKKQLLLILEQKEIFWRQRSKQLWLHSGDKNSKFFHASATAKIRSNQIHRLKDGEGN
ncbi:uncharacterized protein LOC141659850 [Apium graveolens]|uniref:uncharacterized protein LOC141659850 n=1 Tax=Apium graveolens TaxID=4045 RepID=UPI003D7C0E28